VIATTFVVAGASGPGSVGVGIARAQAQAPNPCALITVDDVEPVAVNMTVAQGVPSSFPSAGHESCRYTWGAGTGRFVLEVAVIEPSRMFPNSRPDQIKQLLQGSIRAGTYDEVVSDIGDAAVFKPDSFVYASATALAKGRIVQVNLDGGFARDMKGTVVELLKTAVSRL